MRSRHLQRGHLAAVEEQEGLDDFGPAAALAVPRSKDEFQRKILAAVPCNYRWRDPSELLEPSYTELGTQCAEALATVRAGQKGLVRCGLDEAQ